MQAHRKASFTYLHNTFRFAFKVDTQGALESSFIGRRARHRESEIGKH